MNHSFEEEAREDAGRAAISLLREMLIARVITDPEDVAEATNLVRFHDGFVNAEHPSNWRHKYGRKVRRS